MTIEELKNYLRIDHSLDDKLLKSLQTTAEHYVLSSVEEDEAVKQDERFDLAVSLLVGHWYENRSAATNGGLQQTPLGVRSMIQQLRGLYEKCGDSDG